MSTLRSRSNTATSPPATPSSRSSPTSESEVADATRTDSCGQDGEGQPQSVAVTREDSREDTSFQLYDLRVDLFCNASDSELSGNGGKSDGRNEGNSGVKSSNGEVKRVMCNAKPTDYLTLKGEMLYLPDKQGVSIYSLGEPFVVDLILSYRPLFDFSTLPHRQHCSSSSEYASYPSSFNAAPLHL